MVRSHPNPQRSLPFALALALALVAAPDRARAAFHLWDITEVFSNADGSIQYIELATASSGQEFLQGHSITATSTTGGSSAVQTFVFDYDLSGGSTAGERFLIATPGFANLPGAPTPDYILPCGPFFDPGADTIEIDFAGWDVVSFTSAQLPTDGVNAIDDNDASIANSPEPFLGAPGSLSLDACQISGACDACDDGAFCNGAEFCSGSVCGTSDPCPGELCNESIDACVECLDAGDCSDGNECTEDVCNAGTCETPNNTDPCEDGLFCTAIDTCSGGSCVGAGDPCTGGDMCSETMDACVECLVPGDCSDGIFCNGAETCTLGSCGAGNAPCVGNEMCDEVGDVCVECLDAGDCDDGNPCTDDSCPAGTCMYVSNTDGCDDGLFCTTTDVCAGGVCTGSGDACPGQNCLEGSDSCGGCTDDAECDDGNPCTVNTCDSNACVEQNADDNTSCADDGLFCSGTESCRAGVCTGNGDPCGSGQTCDDALDACRFGCGDAIVAGSEDCDDGNSDAGDGCSASCELEQGYACVTQGNVSVCNVVFGDGLVAGEEACDDGNNEADDGCFEGEVEPGYRCDDANPNRCERDVVDAGADPEVFADAGTTARDAGAPSELDGGGGSAISTDGTESRAPGVADANAPSPGATNAGDDGGCGCRAAAQPRSGNGLPWLTCLTALLLRRRRRQR